MHQVKTTKDSVKAHYALKGQDVVELAKDWIAQWASKVEPHTTMLMSKMQCAMADEPCGCTKSAFYIKCSGPYPPVPVEILMEVLEQGLVEGVKMLTLPAPQAFKWDGKVKVVEFMGPHSLLVGGPALVKYVQKI
jgi:hypothetical protein